MLLCWKLDLVMVPLVWVWGLEHVVQVRRLLLFGNKLVVNWVQLRGRLLLGFGKTIALALALWGAALWFLALLGLLWGTVWGRVAVLHWFHALLAFDLLLKLFHRFTLLHNFFKVLINLFQLFLLLSFCLLYPSSFLFHLIRNISLPLNLNFPLNLVHSHFPNVFWNLIDIIQVNIFLS